MIPQSVAKEDFLVLPLEAHLIPFIREDDDGPVILVFQMALHVPAVALRAVENLSHGGAAYSDTDVIVADSLRFRAVWERIHIRITVVKSVVGQLV